MKTLLIALTLCTGLVAQTMPDMPFQDFVSRKMQEYGVPGVSIAVVEEYQLAWTAAFGFANLETSELVKKSTLFQAGTLTQPLTAMAALTAFEAKAIPLDTDVNTLLPNWNFPATLGAESGSVTLLNLLDHSAGVSERFFEGYQGDEPLPTVGEVLEGRFPAKNDPIRVVSSSDNEWHYSSGGYLIVQQLLSDLYHESFPSLMEQMVLYPLKMSKSTFNPYPTEAQRAAPYGPFMRPIEGGPRHFAEVAAAGLWSTPIDLARFLIAVQQALKGERLPIPSTTVAKILVTPADAHHAPGFIVNVNKYGDEVGKGGYFMQRGFSVGYLSLLIGSLDGGSGAIVMINSSPESLSSIEIPQWGFFVDLVQYIADQADWQ